MINTKKPVKVNYLVDINPELHQVTPTAEIISLPNACVSLSEYARSEIKTSFLLILSLPALDTYVNIDERCRVAIDMLISRLEERYPLKEKLTYGWKGMIANLSVFDAIVKYGNVSFGDTWIPEYGNPKYPAMGGEWAFEELSEPIIGECYTPASTEPNTMTTHVVVSEAAEW